MYCVRGPDPHKQEVLAQRKSVLPSAVLLLGRLTLHSVDVTWSSFAPYANKSATVMPGLQTGERLEPGNLFTCKQSQVSMTSHAWESSFNTRAPKPSRASVPLL